MKKISLKILSLLLITTFISSFAVSGAGAFRDRNSVDSVPLKNIMTYSETQPDTVTSFDREGFKAYLYTEFANFNPKIDISSYNLAISAENKEMVANIIWYEMPAAFHVVGLSLWKNETIYSSIGVTYDCSASQYAEKVARIEEVSTYLLRGLDSSSLTDAEKAVILHDRLAVWCEYDKRDPLPDSSRHIDGVLVNQVAVCTGYSLAYSYLMGKLGIECSFVSSEQLNHAWNVVTINGTKYHMDVTWDDKTFDTYGRVYHDYCLRSTSYFLNNKHYATDYDNSPTDTTYDGLNYWDDSLTEIQYFGGSIYYIDSINSKICRRVNGQSVVICDISEFWGYRTNMGNDRYSSSYSRLSSDEDNLYFSSTNAVKRVDPVSGTVTSVYIPVMPGADYKIFGFKAENDTFYLDISDYPSLSENSRELYSQQYTYANNYAITYNTTGSSTQISPQKKRNNTDIQLSSIVPVKTGYTFLGWASSSEATAPEYQPGDTYTANESICLYALWQANVYTVSLNANSGTCAENSRQVVYGTAYGTLPVPLLTGYSFNGWYTSRTGGDKVYAQDYYLIPGNSVLFAHWTPLDVTVTFDPGEGECNTQSITVKYDSTCGTLPQPVRNGYSFTGWYDANGVQFTASTQIKTVNGIALHATWSRSVYTLFFNPGEGTCTVHSKSLYYGDAYGELPVPVRENYDFLGWYDAASGGNRVSSVTTMGCSGNVTLYAHWKVTTYRLSFDAQNGTAYNSLDVEYQSVPILPTPVRSGYFFTGWSIDGKPFPQGSKFTFKSDKTAVAQWHKISRITIDSNPGTVTVDKYTNVHLTCSVALGDGESIVWKDGKGNILSNTKECTIETIKSTTTVRAIVVYNGIEMNRDEETINVETGFVKVIIAFLKYIFGILPDYNQ